MKKLLLFLLTLALLFSSFPVVTAAAETALPKDETGADASPSTTETKEDSLLTDYDALYIGADGSKMANGGSLVALYTAYGSDPSVLLQESKWQNKMDTTGETDATLVGGSAYWQSLASGGIGYDMTLAEWTADGGKVGLTLPDAFGALYSFSVETVSSVKGLRNAEGALETSTTGITADQHRSSFRFELMSCAFFGGYAPDNESESYCGRWHFSRKSPNKHGWGKPELAIKHLADDTWKENGFVTPTVLGTSYTKQTAKDGVAYTIAYHCGASIAMQMSGGYYGPAAYFVKKADYTRLTSTDYDDRAPVFSLFNGLPADVYAIRVYNMPLTDAERSHNFFIDLMAITGTPLDEYLAMTAAQRATVESALSLLPLTSTREEVEAAFENASALMPKPVDKDELLYVTDGLIGIFSAFPSLSTGYTIGTGSGTWYNGMGGDSADLIGTGWKAGKNGGVTIVKTLEEFEKSSEFGITLPASLLPSEGYTVELIANPTGISKENPDGTLSHYYDERPLSESTGIWREYGFAIGPLRALQACCMRDPSWDAQLERRWVYNATGGCRDLGWKYRRMDNVWKTLDYEQIVSFVISHEFSRTNGSTYQVYNDYVKLFALSIPLSEYKTPDEASNMFRLMCSVAGTAYSVRVYDRPLTDMELAKNHVADLIYFYKDLDATLYLDLMAAVDGDTDIYTPFLDMGFNLSAEEAQAAFNKALGSIWLSYEGLGLSGRDGTRLRYYFGLNESGANGIIAAGYDLEIGILLNVGKNTAPLLTIDAYDYKIVGFDSFGGRNSGFFTDEDTFALTLRYEGLEKRIALESVSPRGYIKMTDAEGNEMIFYVDVTAEDFDPTSLFGVCHKLQSHAAITSNLTARGKVMQVLEDCFTNTTVYVQAGAADGNGTKDAPFHSFADGWKKCKELLASAVSPTKLTLMLGDGEYGVYEALTLTGDDMVYPYTEFEIASESGRSTLTTTVDMDASGFTEVSDNVWVFQLDKKGDAYPAFRYLYVNGERAEIAHATGESDDDNDIQVMAFPRTYDAIYEKVKTLYETGELTAHSVSGYPASRSDLEAKFNAYKEAFLALSEGDALPATTAIEDCKIYFPLTAVSKHGNLSSGKVTGIRVNVYMAMQWYFNFVRADAIDFDDVAVDENGNKHVAVHFIPEEYKWFHEQSGHQLTGRYCCFFEDLSYLDEEGEMYYDKSSGKVYYYTEGDMTKNTVARPTAGGILRLDGVHDVYFSDITFTGTDDYRMSESPTCTHLGTLNNMFSDPASPGMKLPFEDAAVWMQNVSRITFYGCRFAQLATKGVYSKGHVKNLRIESCEFTDLGANGIYFGSGSTRWVHGENAFEGAVVTDNLFEGIGQVYRNAAAIFLTLAKDVSVTSNTLRDCAYTAISAGFGFQAAANHPSDSTFYNLYNVEIAYNYITDFMTELGDGAAIYVAGGNSDADDERYFNAVHHNYVVMSNRTGNGLGHMLVSLYFDGASSNWKCYENVIAEQSYGAFAGENDDLFAEDDPYTVELRRRATECYYIYLQYIKGQEAYTILCSGNIFLNVRATKPADQSQEAFSGLVDGARNLREQSSVYVNGVTRIPASAEDIAYGAGCYDHYGDPTELGGNDY